MSLLPIETGLEIYEAIEDQELTGEEVVEVTSIVSDSVINTIVFAAVILVLNRMIKAFV